MIDVLLARLNVEVALKTSDEIEEVVNLKTVPAGSAGEKASSTVRLVCEPIAVMNLVWPAARMRSPMLNWL